MRKIPTIYERDPATKLRYVKNERHPDCGWVFDGEGVATYKWDGTAVMLDDDLIVWKRRQVKAGEEAPIQFRQEGEEDPETGKRVGWVPCNRDDPADRWHWEACDAKPDETWEPGTYELIGPKVRSNPHGLDEHRLIRHGVPAAHIKAPIVYMFNVQRALTFGSIRSALEQAAKADPGFEGVVWHHPDGRMAKIKAKDFPR